MKKKILSGILAIAMMFSLSGGISVNAATLESVPENVISENNEQMEFLQISDEEIPIAEIPETELNVADRSYIGEDLSLSDGIMPYSENDDVSNTDPNNAYLVENDNAYQGSIESEEEFRWYGFEVTEKSKVTIFLQMAETLDADLYMFSLDTETYSLDLVGGSATEGLGVSEYYADVLEPGIYYFAAAGYEGTGTFAFAFFQSSSDASYEVNDTLSTATSVTIGSSATGVIDSPLDIDYYQVTVAKGYIMKYSISTSNGYSLLFAGKSGSNAAIYTVGDDNTVYITPGTYYFAVLSESDTYSATSTYTVNFRKVHELAADSSANVIGICDEAGIVFQTNSSGSVYYVNGNPIDISYSYSNSSSNSAGSQSYNISITDRDNVYAYLGDDALAPAAIYYMKSTRPAMSVSSRAALELTFYSDSNFYSVHCVCTGAYKENNLWQDFKAVTVIIDPSTGKLIDIESFNYYYDYAVGSNSLTFTRRYPSMTLYQYGN